jgi:vitamin B12 transporter
MARTFARRCVPARILSILILLIGVAASASAQQGSGSVSGVVTDPLGARVAGARVTLTRDGAQTAETVSSVQGEFAFNAVASDRYQIVVTATGFEPLSSAPFFVGAGRTIMDVSLQIGQLQQEVVVTASANAVPQSQVGAAVTVIGRDTLDALAKPDVLEALRLMPGAVVVQTGAEGGTTSLFVRGGASNFNKVLIDGVPANDIGGAFDFSEVTTTGVEQVEMLRDANSVLYGSDALTGVVSLTTRKGRTRVPEVSVSVDGGSFSTGREDVSAGGAVDRFDYFADFSHFNTDNSVPNNAYKNNTFASRVGWAFGRGTDLSVTARHMSSSAGIPNGAELFGISDDSTETADATYVSAALQSQMNDRWQTTVRFASMDQGYHAVNPAPTGQPFDPFDSGFPNYLGNVVTLHGANGYSVTGQAILDYSGDYPQPYDASTTRRGVYGQTTAHLSNMLDLSGGARLEHEDGSTTFAGGAPSATTRTNGGVFGEARLTLHRVFVNAGVAYDHNAVFKSAVTPRLSVAAYLRDPSSTEAFGDTKLTLNAGTGIKAPSISQELSSLYALAQTAGSQVAVPGLAPIGPERNRSFDAGIEQGFWGGRARARASYFDNQFSDLIEYIDRSVLPQLGIPISELSSSQFGAYVNSSSYYARGLETSIETKLGPMVRVVGSYTYMHAVVTQSFASSALAPAFNPAFPTIAIGAYGPLVGAAPFRHPSNLGSLLVTVAKGPAQVALAGYFAGKSDDSTFLSDGYFGNSMLLPNHDLDAAYQKIDLSASYRIVPRVRWYLSIQNLLNQAYDATFGFPALRRGARTGITVTLGGR